MIIDTSLSNKSETGLFNDFHCDEVYLLDNYEKDFDYQIRNRGLDYYQSNKIINVFKNKNVYITKVKGSGSEVYKVVLKVHKDNISYSCTCPYSFHCKHEYAVLIAISNKEYSQIKLKKEIKEQDTNLKAIIEKIPAEELKTYLLSATGMDKVAFEMEAFTNYFRKYYPMQSYDYYYNNLYNVLVIEDDYLTLVESYLNRVKQYISGCKFNEVVNILKALINAFKDTDRLNAADDFTDLLPRIGMFLRVTYRKADERVKVKIREWISVLKKANFYGNYYLEDIIISIE